MNINRLIEMANDIGNYFKAEPDQQEAVNGIRNHLQRFWEQRMQQQIIEYLDKDGDKLDPLVREAVLQLKESKHTQPA